MQCKGLVGLIFGHNFEARYGKTFGAVDPQVRIKVKGAEAAELLDNFRSSTHIYIYDVCIRCGETSRHDDPNLPPKANYADQRRKGDRPPINV